MLIKHVRFKVAELRDLLQHMMLAKSGLKHVLVQRIVQTVANNPKWYRHVVIFVNRRELTAPSGRQVQQAQVVRQKPARQKSTRKKATRQQGGRQSSTHHVPPKWWTHPKSQPVPTAAKSSSTEAFRVSMIVHELCINPKSRSLQNTLMC